MFNFAVSRESLLSGFQWFFFIFCNTVVVPPTLLSAFQLPQSSLLTLTQYAFLATALACFAQAFCGHRRAIMEGPGGLWWGTILTITLGEASRGTPINDIATSLAVGIALSGVLTVLIGFSGSGHRLARLFTPSVMVLFMLMLGAQLTTIFFKGMLGLPFGIADPNFKIQLPPFALSVAVMCLVLGMIIFLPTFCPLWPAGRHHNRLVVVVLLFFLLRTRSPVSCTGSGSRSAVAALCRRELF